MELDEAPRGSRHGAPATAPVRDVRRAHEAPREELEKPPAMATTESLSAVLDGTGPEHGPLPDTQHGLSLDDIAALPTFTYRA